MLRGGSYDRGASVVGVLLLLAVVGAFAIHVDSLASSDRNAQFAASLAAGTPNMSSPQSTDAVKQPLESTPGADEAEAVSQACEVGEDYFVAITGGGKPVIRNVVRAEQTQVRPISLYTVTGTKNYSHCAGGRVPVLSATDGSGRRCTPQGWKCRTYTCMPILDNLNDSSGSLRYDMEACKRMPDTNVGGSIEKAYTQPGGDTTKPPVASGPTSVGGRGLGAGQSAQQFDTLSTEDQQRLAEINEEKAEAQDVIDNGNLWKCYYVGGSAWKDWSGTIVKCPTKEEVAAAEANLAKLEEQEKLLREGATGIPLSERKSDATPPQGCLVHPEACGGKFESTFAKPPPDPGPGPGGDDNYCVVSVNPLKVIPGPVRPGCHNYNSSANPSGGGLGSALGNMLGSLLGRNQNGQCGALGSLIGTCQEPPKPTCQITATRNSSASTGQTNQPQPVTLSWRSERAYSGWLSNAGQVPPQGTMTVYPQVTTTYVLQVEGFRDRYTGEQPRGECETQVTIGGNGAGNGGGGGAGSPSAELSCSPKIADVGMPVAISFGCANSSVSAGSNFSTDNKLSGSATPTIAKPQLGSNNKQVFGLTCMKEGKTDTKECTVEVNETSILLVANPNKIASGAEVNIGWVTGGMEECVIENDDLPNFTEENKNNTSASGVAKSPPITGDTEFKLSCTTRAGSTKTATIKVEVE